ncbi:hypothetical protein ANN_10337 [Periplaneta americana]|uniref:RNase H type-1 domain-containing protein n=1 Tax=Periplaneta americana TaxID=6978 RepID=A0ABQ8TRJ0_PERAM|nr:hypothetical protein ANN_10337 [Periplaneta americana]
MQFFWIKTHVGTYGNELADRLAMAAAQNKYAAVCFDRVPYSIVQTEIEEGKLKWQKEWDDTTKGAITKSYFPNVKERLKMELNITAIFTSMFEVNEKRKILIVDAFYVKRYLFLQCDNFVISIEYNLPFTLYGRARVDMLAVFDLFQLMMMEYDRCFDVMQSVGVACGSLGTYRHLSCINIIRAAPNFGSMR